MFPNLTGDGRVWIHTANRVLTPPEQEDVVSKMEAFTAQWKAHGAQLMADFTIYRDQVLILAVDENFEAASGCSIDSAFAIIKQIEAQYQFDLFNRLMIPFLISDEIIRIPMSELNTAFESGTITEDSILLDTSLSSLNDLRTRFLVPLKNSWLSKKIKTLV